MKNKEIKKESGVSGLINSTRKADKSLSMEISDKISIIEVENLMRSTDKEYYEQIFNSLEA